MKTYEEILTRMVELQAELDALKPQAIAEIKEQIHAFDLTIADLFDVKKRKAYPKAPVKYQQGDQKWTGRGKAPKWIVEYESAGNSREALRV